MADRTKISWCDHTFQIWWGCEHAPADDPDSMDVDPAAISEECRNCYAETFDHRLGGEHWGPGAEPRWFDDKYWAKPLTWNARAEKRGVRERVFCSSMADWAQRHRDPLVNGRMDRNRARMWNLIRQTPWLDWLLLTKRAERLAGLLPWERARICGCGGLCDSGIPCPMRRDERPWPNVWIGVTAGTQRSLWRVDYLRRVRAAKRFISCEPLLEHIPAEAWDKALVGTERYIPIGDTFRPEPAGLIDWLIVGDESGPHRRPAQLDWVRTAREAALRHGVTFHFKQWHQTGKKVHLPVLDGRTHPGVPR